MEKYDHIIEMENIMIEHEKMLKNLNLLLEKIENNKIEYETLIDYYYSDKRIQDLRDEEEGLIPNTINRGVLSEDEIYNLMVDYYDSGIKMLEVGTSILKK